MRGGAGCGVAVGRGGVVVADMRSVPVHGGGRTLDRMLLVCLLLVHEVHTIQSILEVSHR